MAKKQRKSKIKLLENQIKYLDEELSDVLETCNKLEQENRYLRIELDERLKRIIRLEKVIDLMLNK